MSASPRRVGAKTKRAQRARLDTDEAVSHPLSVSGARIGMGLIGIGGCAALVLFALSDPHEPEPGAPAQPDAPARPASAPGEPLAESPGASERSRDAASAGREPGAADPEAPTPDLAERRRGRFEEAALVEVGIPLEDARSLRERYEESEERRAELLTLRQQRRLRRDESEELRNLLLEQDFGPEDYDRMLYALGRDNRVGVSGVAPNGAAARAGLRPGDLVLRYDGQQVFSVPEFRTLTAEAQPGTPVAIEYQRGSEILEGWIDAGRAGMGLEPDRRPPLGSGR